MSGVINDMQQALDALPTQLDDDVTAATLVALDCWCEREVTVHHLMQPSPPTREIYEYDDDGAYVIGTHTDEEMAELQIAYEAARKEWYRTLGQVQSPGPITWHAEVKLTGGRCRKYIGDGKAWHCVEARSEA